MKILTAIVIVAIVIWYLDYISPEKKRKRKIKFDAYAKDYEEKIARSKEVSFKKGEEIGRTISSFLSKSKKTISKH